MPALKEKPKTQETETQENDGWVKGPSSSLPPFCILQIGNTATGVLISRDIQKDEKKVKGKLVTQERVLYRLKLTDESQGLNGGKDNGVQTTYRPGTVVTVPGAGALDRSMDLIALQLAGKDMDAEDPTSQLEPADYDHLKGREFRITRLEDSKMKGGAFKGKPVKVYDIEHREPRP